MTMFDPNAKGSYTMRPSTRKSADVTTWELRQTSTRMVRELHRNETNAKRVG